MTTRDQPAPAFVPDIALIAKVVKIVSGKWRLYLILVLGEQTLRNNQLSELLPGVSPKVLAGELKALVKLGVIQRVIYAEVPPRVEYSLTEKGRLALPPLQQLQPLGRIF